MSIQIDVHPVSNRAYEEPDAPFDAVSATANAGGFMQLACVAGHFGWNAADITRLAKMVNARNEVGVAPGTKPLLFIVSKTKATSSTDAVALMQDLLNACRENSVKVLHFTHYRMLLSDRPLGEIVSLMAFVFAYDEPTTLEKIIWDIDELYAAKLSVEMQKIGIAIQAPIADSGRMPASKT